ncbi:Asp23/Gls24 family envelope stress response protein [Rubrobacter marinus]|uniref:Asp23/Gls24 family envelope stress response protein n=1 Tax=Rubrobacter marinus TaxID=2653852 RepID=UPI001A9E1B85|nr:Asp23/Gls24 family envelope stress response protein [Rubrobacter marinus]
MAETAERARSAQDGGSPLVTGRGKTTIKSAVVSSIVSEAVAEVSGAEPEIAGRGASIPGDNSPTVGEFFSRVTGSSRGTRGISVEVGEREAAVDATVTVPYGRSIPEVTGTMRDVIVQRVENMTGLRVTEVNITVKDVIVPQQQ